MCPVWFWAHVLPWQSRLSVCDRIHIAAAVTNTVLLHIWMYVVRSCFHHNPTKENSPTVFWTSPSLQSGKCSALEGVVRSRVSDSFRAACSTAWSMLVPCSSRWWLCAVMLLLQGVVAWRLWTYIVSDLSSADTELVIICASYKLDECFGFCFFLICGHHSSDETLGPQPGV